MPRGLSEKGYENAMALAVCSIATCAYTWYIRVPSVTQLAATLGSPVIGITTPHPPRADSHRRARRVYYLVTAFALKLHIGKSRTGETRVRLPFRLDFVTLAY